MPVKGHKFRNLAMSFSFALRRQQIKRELQLQPLSNLGARNNPIAALIVDNYESITDAVDAIDFSPAAGCCEASSRQSQCVP